MNQINNYARVLGRGKSFQCEKWSPLHTYQNNPLEQDFVVHKGSLWVCLENCVAGEDEPGINNKWKEVCRSMRYEDLTEEQLNDLLQHTIRNDIQQDLTEEQKNQARENINAVAKENGKGLISTKVASLIHADNEEATEMNIDANAVIVNDIEARSVNVSDPGRILFDNFEEYTDLKKYVENYIPLEKGYGINSVQQKSTGCTSSGEKSFAVGEHTITTNRAEHAEGIFNKSNSGTIHSVGIGTNDIDRVNAFEIMQNGDIYIFGIGGYDGTNAGASNVITLQQYLLNLAK